MRKTVLKILLSTVVILLCFGMSVFAAGESDVLNSGTCGAPGANLSWSLSKDYELTISGFGFMEDYYYDYFILQTNAPWASYSSQITSVVIKDGVQSIGSCAFYNFWSLSSVTIGKNVSRISNSAFYYVGNDTPCKIVFAGNAPEIDSLAFEQSNFAVCYPASASGWSFVSGQDYSGSITWYAADGSEVIASGYCGEDADGNGTPDDNLTWTLLDEGVLVISGHGPMMDYQWYSNPAPWHKSMVNFVYFDEACSITKIGKQAFYEFGNLYAIELPGTVTTIGEGAFYRCIKMESLVLPANLQTIGAEAFLYCPSISSVTIPAGVTSIGSMAFAYSGLKNVTMLGSEPVLGERVFDGCKLTTYAPWTSASSDQWGTLVSTAPSDTTPPVLTVSGPEDGSTLTGLYATFEVTATDSGSDVTVTMSYQKGSETVTVSAAPYEIRLWELGDGELTVSFSAEDAAGNTASKLLRYTVDVYPDAPTGLAAQSCETGIRLTWTEPENTDNIEVYNIYLVEPNGDLIFYDFVFKGTTEWIDTEAGYENTYTYALASEASNQLLSDYTDPVTITYILPDTEKPTISEVWPSDEDAVTLCHDADFLIAADDNVGISRAEVWCSVDGNDPFRLGASDSPENGVFTVHGSLDEISGPVVLSFLVVDEAGNYAEKTAAVTIRAYAAPTAPASLRAESGLRQISLGWSYTGDIATLRQFRIYSCDENGENAVLLAGVKNYSYTVGDLDAAAYFLVTAEDIYGEESEPAIISAAPVTTESVPPKAVLSNAKLTGVTGKAINFSGAGSTDNDAILSYFWDFGDGNEGTGVNIAHTYMSAGTFTVTLTVTDRSGNTDSAEAEVTICDTLGADADHAVLTVTVIDGYRENTPGIAGAVVTVYNDGGFEIAAKTDADGKVELIVPNGAHTMTVVKDGFGAKAQKLDVAGDETGSAAAQVYLAASGVSVIDGQLTTTPMTREEIIEAGIDMDEPANNHVVKHEVSIRFQPSPELQFDLPIDVIVNAAGDMLKGNGFGWHTFTPDEGSTPSPSPDPDLPSVSLPGDWVTPSYDVGVFPVGNSAFMVIYGQTHWLKEMFNVELIVYNTSYAEDITSCYAELTLPEGMSLANMLEGEQQERVSVGNGTIEYIGKTDGAGTPVGSPVRTVNWYVRGDAAGDYSLSAAVTGKVGGTPFETTFTTEEAVRVYAGSALKLTVTMPKSAYAEKDYVVNFTLTNVSDRPICNLSFALDGVQQFRAEYLSNGETGEIREELDNEDFENKKTYGLPELLPGDTFNVTFRTTFLYEHKFFEWALGKVPVPGLETGYRVAETFVTTMNGSTTEIPVEIVLTDVEKQSFFEWIWDEARESFKENTTESVLEYVDDELFEGIPAGQTIVKIFDIGSVIKEVIDGPDVTYDTMVTLITEGSMFTTAEEAMAAVSASAYALRRSAAPGVLVWTDAEDYTVSDDGTTMTLHSEGKLYVLRTGETYAADGSVVLPEIGITTHYIDEDGAVQQFTRRLITMENSDGTPVGGAYTPGYKAADFAVVEPLSQNTFAVPEAGETVEVRFSCNMSSREGDILLRALNEVWSVLDGEGREVTEGMTIANGVLVIDSGAEAGVYTVKLALDGTNVSREQTITLTKENTGCEHELYAQAAAPAGCTTDGHKAYWTCTECGKYFSDADGIDEIMELEAWKTGSGKIPAAHSFGELITAKPALHTQTELLGAVAAHYRCGACGKYFTEAKAETTLAALTGDAPVHSDGADADHSCDVCGKDGITDHIFSEAWSFDENYHWRTALCGHDVVSETAAHAYGDDRFCDVCGYTRSNSAILPILLPYPPVVHSGMNGSTGVSPTNPKMGDTVTITPAPDAGYEVERMIVTDKNGGEIAVTDNSDGTYSFTQPLGAVSIEVSFKEASEFCDGGVGCLMHGFADLDKNAWYFAAVHFCVEHGLMNGMGLGIFAPDAQLTRAMLVTVLWRMEGEPIVNYLMRFTDIEYEQWYTEAVRWAAAQRIVGGYGNGLFGTHDAVTREQALAILHRYARSKGLAGDASNPMIPQYTHSEWAETDILWAQTAGLTGEIGTDATDMTAAASRAEIAVWLQRFCETMGEE